MQEIQAQHAPFVRTGDLGSASDEVNTSSGFDITRPDEGESLCLCVATCCLFSFLFVVSLEQFVPISLLLNLSASVVSTLVVYLLLNISFYSIYFSF